ncbi:MAG TPA: 16S rRNA (adenine(1518)-N(6)/adenine(1519)-N(6))-dimethyltransferase RsmA [Acidobacteriaceae bacterium]|nr:16S rRNA (adenine(1518)-N(6)/adenine(1519)-N(6))-dimethyltransferase RsmA [Acidobacteriaceae bacterium]
MAAKPKLGQNFLRDEQAIQRIVAALGEIGDRTVVEIGPGRGAITELLAARAGRLIAVELDALLAEDLERRFAEKLTVRRQDVLTFDFTAAAEEAGSKLLVVGNLPYYITSPILLHLTQHAEAMERAVVMTQREVAERVTAAPGSREYGLLTVAMQLYGKTQTLFTLPPGAFSPPPEVYSTVFRWSFAPRAAELGVEENSFLSLLKQCFQQKRKTLGNNLRAAGYEIATVAHACEKAGVTAGARAETLTLEQFAGLWRAIQGSGHSDSSPDHHEG